MKIGHTAFLASMICALTVMPSSAGDPARTVAMEQNIETAMQSETNTTVFWKPLGDGAVREKRSGLVCTGELRPEMPLVFLSGPVPANNMSVVGCVYRSADNERVVHIILSPNLIGADETRKMLRLALDYQEKEVVSLGSAPIEGIGDSEGEALTAVANGKPRLHYLASAPVGRWLVYVHAFEPKPESVDVAKTRLEPVAVLLAAIANIENAKP